MNVSIVIPYRDNQEGLNACLRSLADNLEVIVVDDISEHAPDVSIRPGTRMIRMPKRGYFAGAVNLGISQTKKDVLVLNQDLVVKGDYLKGLANLSKTYALIGDGVMRHPAWPKGYVQGTFMYLRRDAIDKVGLFNEADWPLWGTTCEWQLRACRAGFQCLPFTKPEWYQHDRSGNFGTSIQNALKQEPDKKDLLIRTPPLVSIVAPCFKHGKYAQELYDSLLAQTFQGWDLTIVDDASPDDSWKLLSTLTPGMEKKSEYLYSDDWCGVKVIRMPKNGGTSVALNAGIKTTLGKYIMAMDGDDMLEPQALARYLKAIQSNPDGLAYANVLLWAKGASFQKWRFKEYNFDELLIKNYIPSGTMFARKSWEQIGGYPEAFKWGRQDWAFAVKMGMNGHCGIWIDEYLYRYRREGQNRVLTNSTNEWMAFFRNQMRTEFAQVYTGRRPMGCCGGRGSTRNQTLASRAASKSVNTMMADAPTSMILIEYIGKNEGRQTYYGKETEQRYVVGAGRRHIYVDRRDAPALLDTRVATRKIFKVYVQPEPTPIVAAEPIIETEPIIEETNEPEKAVEVIEVAAPKKASQRKASKVVKE